MTELEQSNSSDLTKQIHTKLMDDRVSEEQRAALFEDQKQKIITSVFRNLDETYVSHLKIWDGGGPGAKPRYILLSRRY